MTWRMVGWPALSFKPVGTLRQSTLAARGAPRYSGGRNPSHDFVGQRVPVMGSSRGSGSGLVRAFDRCGARCVVNFVADPAGRNHAAAEGVARTPRDAVTACGRLLPLPHRRTVSRRMPSDREMNAGFMAETAANLYFTARRRTNRKPIPAERRIAVQHSA